LSKNAFGCTHVGANIVDLTVTDNNGLSSTCQSTVIVEDKIAPVASCQDITIQLNADGDASIVAGDVDAGSDDACGIASTVLDKTTFGCSDVGANTVKLTVTDPNGNEAFCLSTVTVEDNVAPLAMCQDLAVDLIATGPDEAFVSITPIEINNASNDACGLKSTVLDKATFACSDVGTNTVTLAVTDNNDNVATCTATVTVGGHDIDDDGIPNVCDPCNECWEGGNPGCLTCAEKTIMKGRNAGTHHDIVCKDEISSHHTIFEQLLCSSEDRNANARCWHKGDPCAGPCSDHPRCSS